MVTLDFRNCKTKEDVDKVFAGSGLKDTIQAINKAVKGDGVRGIASPTSVTSDPTANRNVKSMSIIHRKDENYYRLQYTREDGTRVTSQGFVDKNGLHKVIDSDYFVLEPPR